MVIFESTSPSKTPGLRQNARWYLLARLAWVTLVVTSLLVMIAAIRPGYQHYQTLAQSPDFQEAELSPNAVAVYLLAVQVAFTISCISLSVVVFLRAPQNFMVIFISLIGAMFGANIPIVYHLHSIAPTWHLPIAFIIFQCYACFSRPDR